VGTADHALETRPQIRGRSPRYYFGRIGAEKMSPLVDAGTPIPEDAVD
jgi:hypothetical protein